MSRQLFRVATTMSMAYGWGRAIMHGVAEYVRQNRNWLLYSEPFVFGIAEMATHLDAVDGLLVNTRDRTVIDDLMKHGLPAVNFATFPTDHPAPIPSVGCDDFAVGAMAAEHLASLGLRHFCYCGNADLGTSNRRRDGFLAKVAELTGGAADPTPTWMYNYAPQELTGETRDQLGAWLMTLPKPVGVLAYNDLIARHVAEACLLDELAVPQEVAIVGVDNDDLICDLATPPLSSIDPCAVQQGHAAAALLDQWMKGSPPGNVMRLFQPARVVQRQSTSMMAVSDPLVARAMGFILERFAGRIGVGDVVAAAGVSRRKLEYSFKAALGTTPFEEIQRLRLRQARDLLANSNVPVAAVAERCGFSSQGYFTEVFRRANGQPPAAFRRQLLTRR